MQNDYIVIDRFRARCADVDAAATALPKRPSTPAVLLGLPTVPMRMTFQVVADDDRPSLARR